MEDFEKIGIDVKEFTKPTINIPSTQFPIFEQPKNIQRFSDKREDYIIELGSVVADKFDEPFKTEGGVPRIKSILTNILLKFLLAVSIAIFLFSD